MKKENLNDNTMKYFFHRDTGSSLFSNEYSVRVVSINDKLIMLKLQIRRWMFRRTCVTYTQGQTPQPKIREYFYYIDHQGMLFLDDARIKNFTSCFKDKQFLVFFFKRLKPNDTSRYPEFPFLSLCGRERNYVRCDDCPIVYTHVAEIDGKEMFCHNHAGDQLALPFQPDKIFMHPENGRVYHPGPQRGGHIGLVMSKLAIEFSKSFTFEGTESPTHFIWKGTKHLLRHEWYNNLRK